MSITAGQIKKLAPKAKADIVDGIVRHQSLLAKNGIDSPRRISHFMAQCATETQGFTRLEENLFYTTAKRLRQVWPSRFKTEASAKPYLRSPEKLANKVYGGRLGNNKSGDGWKYRGSGMKQTTGKANYAVVQRETGLPVVENPEMLRRFPEALESACIYWRVNKLSRFADNNDVEGLTKAIQGGTGGLTDRRRYLDKAKKIWGSDAASADRPPREPEIEKALAHKEEEITREVQEALREMGFPEVGKVDGRIGTRTRASIAAYRSVRALPAGDKIDHVLLDDISKALDAGWKRPVAETRATATVDDLADTDIAIRTDKAMEHAARADEHLGFMERILRWFGIGGTAAAGGYELVNPDQTEERLGWVQRIWAFIVDNPVILLPIAAVVIGLIYTHYARRRVAQSYDRAEAARRAQVIAYREGRFV